MARILGIDIPNEKKLEVSLSYIYGIGRPLAKQIISATKLNPNMRAKELTEDQINVIYEYIEKNFVVEGALKQRIFQNIKRLKDIRSYRGLRHKAGLPVRGQNTRKNARTRKGKGVTVGGLNKKLDKK
ncbi:MAG: 30S ribosomal protein S13 [Candidatus Doudnabacteria bacterium]|nr:30S ribosomal protein S13 [Candidatus Doudnabacteria bacterium]